MNRRIISIPGLLALALVLALPSSGEAGTPPRPKPSVWIGTGGAVGEAATVQVQYPGQNWPYALVYSPHANPAALWPPILPPYGLLASGSLDAQGGASIPVRVPAASGLVGLHIHLVAAVDDLPSFGRSYSAVCLWAVAPPHPRQFVGIPGPKPIPFLPTDGHARANLQSGQVLFSGGHTGGYMPPARVDAWLYDPVAMTAVRVGNMTTMRQGHAAQPLGDGTVLVSGTWLELHAAAFRAFGGVPKVIVPDSLKAAVVRAAFGIEEEPALNRSYREFARHYGFEIDPTPPRAPEKKGKVERAILYVKRNFLKPRDLLDIRDARRELVVWLREIAGCRRHGTTGQKPAECFEREEKAHLSPLPNRPRERVLWKRVRVHRDSHVQVDSAFYSVPWPLLHKDLWARGTRKTVALYHDDVRVATHRRVGRGKRSTHPEHLPCCKTRPAPSPVQRRKPAR